MTTELIPCASWVAVCKGKAWLKEELQHKEKWLLRLRQVFTAKMAEFVRRSWRYLASKLPFYNNGQVRITSQYDLGAVFVFQPVKDSSTGTSTDAACCTG